MYDGTLEDFTLFIQHLMMETAINELDAPSNMSPDEVLAYCAVKRLPRWLELYKQKDPTIIYKIGGEKI